MKNEYFVPYDWGVLSFVARKSSGISMTLSLDDLMQTQFASKIALQDPRTSSVGLQFLMWVLKVKGEEEGFEYIKKMMKQVQ
jgi:thiamine transport system substrate-binding protein